MAGMVISLLILLAAGITWISDNLHERAIAKKYYEIGIQYYREEKYNQAATEFEWAAYYHNYKDSAAMRDLSRLKYYCTQDWIYYSKGTELADRIVRNKKYSEAVKQEAVELKAELEAAYAEHEAQKAKEAAIAATATPEPEPEAETEGGAEVWHTYRPPTQTVTFPSNPSSTNKPSSTPKPTATPKPSDDPYHASDFAHPEDFYEWYYDDFYDYEEAEEYWEEHAG